MPGVTRFSDYNDSILESLTRRTVADQKVVCIFVDAFGWMFFEKFRKTSALLQRFEGEGTVEKAFSQFPSTTACHVTTIHFGLPVGQTGIFEWNYYEPLADGMISPLLFSYAGDTGRETLSEAGLSGRTLFPFTSFYESLAMHGVPSYVFQSARYTPSSFSNEAFRGATVVTHDSESGGLANLAHHVQSHQGPGYFFLYLDSLDAAAHTFGPHAPETEAVGQKLLETIDHVFLQQVSSLTGVKLMIIADHGQTEVDPSKVFFLDKELPESVSWFTSTSKGMPLVAGGSMRDFFLYVKPEHKERAIEVLSNKLSHMAFVRDTDDLIADGYFGASESLSPRFRERMADVVVLPFPGEGVWWSGNGRFEKAFRGHHGGLSHEEVEVSRLVLDL